MIYQSNITTSNLVMSVSNDIAVYPAIRISDYINWYNDVVQSIYKAVIKPYDSLRIPAKEEIDISDIIFPENSIFPEGVQLYIIRDNLRYKLLTVDNEHDLIFRNSAYIGNGKIKIKSDIIHDSSELVIETLVPPPVITEDNISEITVPFPVEYHDMIKARLKGEALKTCNQDGSAAKWLNDFNSGLEDFKAFHYRTKSIV